MEISAARHAYPEQAGFLMDRKMGYRGEYTFLHFHNPVEMLRGGQRFMTQPHAVILYEPDVLQYFRSYEPLVHDWMHFGGELPPDLGLPLNEICYPTNPVFITEIMAEIENEWFARRAGHTRMLALKGEELLRKTGRALTETEPYSPDVLEKFRALRGQMLMSPEENWTAQRMAGSVFLSESRFYALYRRFFGVSPTADLIHARMNRAKNRLALGEESVEEIAASLGYQNTTHFIRQFKEHCGMTPAKYRKTCI